MKIQNEFFLFGIILAAFINSRCVVASDTLTTISWPTKTECKSCTQIDAYSYQLLIREPVSKIIMLEGLGLEVTTTKTSKIFLFGIPHESILPSIKEKLKFVNITVNSWVDYHELLAKKSDNKTIESLRVGMEIIKAENYYKYKNKIYTAFYVKYSAKGEDNIFSTITIIPNKQDKQDNKDVLTINGNFSKADVELMLGSL